jgi:hypothetical protein
MNIGDLVRRRVPLLPALHVTDTQRLGVVIKLRQGGCRPQHEIASVFYTVDMRQYDIATSLIEVIA